MDYARYRETELLAEELKRQGRFPNTAYESDSDAVFAFVVLGVDPLQDHAGRRRVLLAVPREWWLPDVHSFNTGHLKGVHDAVADAGKRFGRFIRVPIPDEGGSLVSLRS
jgi:hypothetical protein